MKMSCPISNKMARVAWALLLPYEIVRLQRGQGATSAGPPPTITGRKAPAIGWVLWVVGQFRFFLSVEMIEIAEFREL
jgi:hypothetical protein